MVSNDNMDRRSLLATTTAGVVSGLGGCLGRLDAAGSDPLDVPANSTLSDFENPESPESFPVNTGGSIDLADAEQHLHINVGGDVAIAENGNGSINLGRVYRPHEVRILNDAGIPAFEFGILDALNDALIHQKRHEVPNGAFLRATLLVPSHYLLKVYVNDQVSQILQVPCDMFDCNRSQTKIALRSNGDIDSVVVSSTMYCGDRQFSC